MVWLRGFVFWHDSANVLQVDNKPARDAQGRLLPGNSANPMGRPKLPDWFKSRGPDALRVLVAQATGEVIPSDDGTVLPAVQQVASESSPKERTAAAAIIADRIYGKAPDVISGDPDNPIAAAIRVEFIKP
jgi:hypothetical protein